MKTYLIKEIFGPTLQGEGFNAGTPAYFVRFGGCNAWTGRPEDRERDALRTGAKCALWCDTDFFGGTKLTASQICDRLVELGCNRNFMIVVSGGEPALQYDMELHDQLRITFGKIAMETNGSVELKARPDWVCVSPKMDSWVVMPDELKVVYPSYDPAHALDHLYKVRLQHAWRDTMLFIQPEDGPDQKENTAKCLEYVYRNPQWRLSLQTHKVLGVL